MSYCWSDDEEIFRGSFETREEAALAAVSSVEGQLLDGEVVSVWTAREAPLSASEFLGGVTGLILDSASEHAHEGYGDSAKEWLMRVPRDQVSALKRKLEAAFDQWAREYGHEPKFSDADDVHEHRVVRGEGKQSERLWLDGEELA